MTKLNKFDTKKLFKQMKKDLKNPVGPVPTPKLHMVEEKIKEGFEKTQKNVKQLSDFIMKETIFKKETFTEANEYDVEKIKRKLDMFLKTNDLLYLGKVIYLTKELMRDNM